MKGLYLWSGASSCSPNGYRDQLPDYLPKHPNGGRLPRLGTNLDWFFPPSDSTGQDPLGQQSHSLISPYWAFSESYHPRVLTFLWRWKTLQKLAISNKQRNKTMPSFPQRFMSSNSTFGLLAHSQIPGPSPSWSCCNFMSVVIDNRQPFWSSVTCNPI